MASLTPTASAAGPGIGSRRPVAHRVPLAAIASGLILAVAILIALFPFFWVLRTAVTPTSEAFSLRPTLLPTS